MDLAVRLFRQKETDAGGFKMIYYAAVDASDYAVDACDRFSLPQEMFIP